MKKVKLKAVNVQKSFKKGENMDRLPLPLAKKLNIGATS